MNRRIDATQPGPAAPPKTPAHGVDLSTTEASAEPLLPSDRDENVGSTGGVPSQRV